MEEVVMRDDVVRSLGLRDDIIPMGFDASEIKPISVAGTSRMPLVLKKLGDAQLPPRLGDHQHHRQRDRSKDL